MPQKIRDLKAKIAKQEGNKVQNGRAWNERPAKKTPPVANNQNQQKSSEVPETNDSTKNGLRMIQNFSGKKGKELTTFALGSTTDKSKVIIARESVPTWNVNALLNGELKSEINAVVKGGDTKNDLVYRAATVFIIKKAFETGDVSAFQESTSRENSIAKYNEFNALITKTKEIAKGQKAACVTCNTLFEKTRENSYTCSDASCGNLARKKVAKLKVLASN